MIRRADIGDCRDLAALHVLTWQQAYAGLLPQEFLDNIDLDKRFEMWEQALKNEDIAVFLDFENSTPIGFAACGSSQDADATPRWGEIGALYYLQPYWGSGRATTLFQRARDHLATYGKSTLTLWVLDGNSRGIAFYLKHGLEFDGQEKTQDIPNFTMRELRMFQPLI